MQFDFTTTAMRRPGILRDTYQSFAGNLQGVDMRASTLFINIDPLPDEGNLEATKEVAAEFFGHVVINQPESPSFPAAVKWCWRQPTTEYFFHLEDDWVLEKPVHVLSMLEAFKDCPQLACVHLRAYNTCEDGRICLAPGLWRASHAREIESRLVTDANPERQLRAQKPSNPHGGKHEGFIGRHFPDQQIVLKDIGRMWMATMGLRRKGDRDFVRWA